jgi:hypothetical protein
MPLKVIFFFWMCIRGRSQVTADLEAKVWLGEPGCKMSGEFGTVSHLLFGCSVSHFTCWCLKEALG